MQFPKNISYLSTDENIRAYMTAYRREIRGGGSRRSTDLASLLAPYREARLRPKRFSGNPLEIEKDLMRLCVEAEGRNEAADPALFRAIRELTEIVNETNSAREQCLWEKAGLIRNN